MLAQEHPDTVTLRCAGALPQEREANEFSITWKIADDFVAFEDFLREAV